MKPTLNQAQTVILVQEINSFQCALQESYAQEDDVDSLRRDHDTLLAQIDSLQTLRDRDTAQSREREEQLLRERDQITGRHRCCAYIHQEYREARQQLTSLTA